MSSETNLKEHRPWWHISRKLPRNPFDPIELTPHLEWCRHCQQDVDVQVEAANADGTDVYRKTCKRCGQVMQWGIARRSLLCSNPLSAAALKFIRETGKDRR